MAFIEDNFGPVGGFHGNVRATNASGIALFSYITEDALTAVVTAGYFNDLRDDVYQGDVIYLGSKQLDDNSEDNEYSIIYFDSVSRSPSATDVTINTKDINAS